MIEKKWETKVNGRVVRHGQRGVWIGQPGSNKWKSYCARSGGIARKYPSARLPDSPNYQSRKKWKCGGEGL